MRNRKTMRETRSLKVNPEIWKLAKIEAIKEDVELSTFVKGALKDAIKKIEQKRKANLQE